MALTFITQPTANSFHFAGDPFLVKVHSDVSDLNLRCTAVAVVSMDGNNFTTPQIMAIPDINGDFEFNFRKFFTDIFKTLSPTVPDPESVALEILNRHLAWSQIYITEISGDPLAPTGFANTAIFYLYRGGTAKEQFPTYNFLSSYQPNNKQFLTYESTPTKVHIDLPYYACFLQPYGEDTWSVEVNCHDKDGALLGTITPLSVTAGPNTGVYCIPVGFKGLGLDGLGYAAQIDRYNVHVRNGATILSELRLYLVDRTFRRYQRHFLFVNSIAGLSSMNATGESEYSIQGTQQVVDRYLPYGYDVTEGQINTIDNPTKESIKANSGHATHRKVMEYSEILSSLNVWELLTFPVTGGTTRVWVPIVRTGVNNKIKKDNDFMPMLQMEYTYAFKNSFYSPKL